MLINYVLLRKAAKKKYYSKTHNIMLVTVKWIKISHGTKSRHFKQSSSTYKLYVL